MILRPEQIRLLRLTGRHTLANGGGGGGSTSSQQRTDTSTQLTNQVSSTDSRAVASDGAIALGGAGASATLTNYNNTANNTSNALNSGNSTSTAFSSTADSHNSTNFSSDSHNSSSTAFASNVGNSTNTNNSTAFASNVGNSYANSGNTSYSSTTTDFGSVQAAIDGMKSTAATAIGSSGNVAGDAITALSMQSANTSALLGNLFDYAKTSSANSQGTAMQALGLASNSTAQANLSASDQASQASSDKKNMELVMGACAVLVVFLVMRK